MPQLTIRLGRDRDELRREVREPGIDLPLHLSGEFGGASDLDGPSAPRRPDHVVDEERDLRVLFDVSPLLPGSEVQATDVDGVLGLVEEVGHRDPLRLPLRVGGGESPELVLAQVRRPLPP